MTIKQEEPIVINPRTHKGDNNILTTNKCTHYWDTDTEDPDWYTESAGQTNVRKVECTLCKAKAKELYEYQLTFISREIFEEVNKE